MEKERRKRALAAVALVLFLGAMAIWVRMNRMGNELPGPSYYTGAMRSPNHPDTWVTADGKIVPPPPGVQINPAKANQSKPGGGVE